jgi:hypothetical protein
LQDGVLIHKSIINLKGNCSLNDGFWRKVTCISYIETRSSIFLEVNVKCTSQIMLLTTDLFMYFSIGAAFWCACVADDAAQYRVVQHCNEAQIHTTKTISLMQSG